MTKPPRILKSPLTDKYYIVTRYSVRTAPNGSEYIMAQTKYDCTGDVMAIVNEAVAERDAKITELAAEVEALTERVRSKARVQP